MKEISEKLQEAGIPQVHPSTIHKNLHGALFTVKKMDLRPLNRNSDAAKEKRRKFTEWFLENHDKYNLVWIDETGLDLYLSRTLGRSRIGHRCHKAVSNSRGRHMSVIMAVPDKKRVIQAKKVVGGVKKACFWNFIDELCKKLKQDEAENGKPCCLCLTIALHTLM